MSKSKRGGRGSKVKDVVVLNVRDEAQLERTLSLDGIVGDKPSINGIMPIIEKRLDAESIASCYDRVFGYDEDYVFNDPYSYLCDIIDSKRLKKLNKRLYKGNDNVSSKKVSKGKRNSLKYCNYGDSEDDYWVNRHTMYSSDEWDDGEYKEGIIYKCIKFYSDVEDELSVREFDNLKDFSDFCGREGYYISSTDYSNLVNWDVIHCCLDPISLEYGNKELLTDNSYGALYWTVSEDMTKYCNSGSVNKSKDK